MARPVQSAERLFTMQPTGGNDATPPSGVSCAKVIFIGGAGTLIVDTLGGDSSVTLTCVAGQRLDISVTKVYNGSGATGIVGGYWGG